MKKYWLLLGFLCLIGSIFAQTTNQQATELYQKALQNIQQGKFDLAISDLETAASIFDNNNDKQNATICRLKLYELYLNTGKLKDFEPKIQKLITDAEAAFGLNSKITSYAYLVYSRYLLIINNFSKSQQYNQKSLSITKNLYGDNSIEYANSLNDYALLLYNLQKNDSALFYLNKVLSIYQKNNNYNTSNILYNIANLYYSVGNVEKATQLAMQILNDLKANNNFNSEQTARVYMLLGNIYSYRKDLTIANEYYEKSNTIIKQLYGENSQLLVDNYINQGNLMYLQNNFDFALQYYFLAMKQLENSVQNPLSLISLYNNIGMLYSQTFKYDNALLYYNKALDLKSKYFETPDEHTAIIYNNIGIVHQKLQNYSQSIEYYKKSEEILTKSYGLNHPTLTKIFLSLATIYMEKNSIDTAQTYYYKAILSNQIQPLDINTPSFYKNTQIYSKLDLFNALNGIIIVNITKFNQTKDLNFLKTMDDIITFVDTLVNQIRFEIITDEDKISINEQISNFFQNTAIVYHNLYFQSNEPRYIAKLFYFVEKSKSSTLMTNVSSIFVADSAFNEYNNNIKSLKEKIRSYYQQIAITEDLSKHDFYRQMIIEANQQIEALNIQFKQLQAEKIHSILKPVDLNSLQILLDDTTAIVNYFFLEKIIIAIVVTRKEVLYYTTPLDKNLFNTLSTYSTTVISPQKQDYLKYQKSAYDLYEKLFFFDLPQNTKKLIIIPVDELTTLAFDALLTQKVDNINKKYSELPYLINKYSISISYSASLWAKYYMTDYSKIERQDILAIAPVFKPDNQQTYRANSVSTILGTEKEVNNIFDLFKSYKYTGTRLLNRKANEYLLKLIIKSNDYKIIHIASHGVIDYENPNLSAVILSRDSLGIEDGILFASEISNQKFNAELINLSACETGQGKLYKGEGVVGLAYAFLSAGAKNLIISLWKVSDEATVELMYNFYDNLLKNNTILDNCHRFNESLTYSKRKMIQGKYSHPYFWAAFTLIGM